VVNLHVKFEVSSFNRFLRYGQSPKTLKVGRGTPSVTPLA